MIKFLICWWWFDVDVDATFLMQFSYAHTLTGVPGRIMQLDNLVAQVLKFAQCHHALSNSICVTQSISSSVGDDLVMVLMLDFWCDFRMHTHWRAFLVESCDLRTWWRKSWSSHDVVMRHLTPSVSNNPDHLLLVMIWWWCWSFSSFCLFLYEQHPFLFVLLSLSLRASPCLHSAICVSSV